MKLTLALFVTVLSACGLLPVTLFAQATPPIIDHSDLTFYLDETGQRRPIENRQHWETRRRQILEGMQAAMGPLPAGIHQFPLNIEIVQNDSGSGDGWRRDTITFAADANDRVTADLYYPVPLQDDEQVPGIVALHPTGALGKRIVAGEGPRTNRQYAVELAQRGYIVIAPDYPSFGDEKDYDFHNDAFVSGTMKGIVNHMRCVDLLQSLPQVDAERIGVIGHSLGGHNAMFVGVFDERIDVVVTSCGWTPFHDYYEGNIKGWTSDRYMPLLRDKYELDPDKVPFDFYEVVAALAPRGFFSSSPKDDSNFEVKGVKKAIPRALGVYSLYDAEDKLKVVYPEAEHDFPTETREQSYRFIDDILEHTPRHTLDYAAELPRIPGKSPEQALATFDLVDGFRLEQTAAEPLVTDPVAMSFDEDGRLYVIEMKDYSEQDTERLGQVRLLTDTDGDGRFDESVIFADGLSWPTAIICSHGGVFVGAAPHIYFLQDADGDGKADEQNVVLTGFARSNVQGLLNSFRWGWDNRIHGATSSSGGVVKRTDDPNDPGVNLRGRDFSFDPRTLELRPESGGAQHGMSFDDWGRKFVCSNSDHAQMVMYDDRDIARNPKLRAPGPRIRIADDGGQAPVYRSSPVEPWRIVRTRLRVSGQVRGPVEGGGKPAGYFTGATGITIFRGDAWGEDAKGTVFVGDVGSNIVHRKKLTPNGTTFIATRIDQNDEFLRSSDVWFRPVQFANAPDGCLHILDMYRETIEHPASLPPQIKQHLDLTSGRDRGRLYRIVPEAGLLPRENRLGDLHPDDLVEFLSHSNAWHRLTASRLLFEHGDLEDSTIRSIAKLARNAQSPYGRVHALTLLDSLNQLDVATLRSLLKDSHPRVREVAVRVAKHHAAVQELATELMQLQSDEDARVRYELAFAAGALPLNARVEILTTLLSLDGADSWMRLAAFSSLSQGIDQVFSRLLQSADVPHATVLSVFEQLAVQSTDDIVIDALSTVASLPMEQSGLQSELVLLAFQRRPELRGHFRSGALQEVLEQVLERARNAAFAPSENATVRVQAIEALSLSTQAADAEQLLDVLESSDVMQVRSAAMHTLAQLDPPALASRLIDNWSTLSPQARLEAEELLFGRPEGTETVLTALESGALSTTDISTARLQALSQSKNDPVRKRATAILQKSPRPQRAAIVQEYRAALALDGNPGRGRQVFLKNCSTCHRLNGEGIEIGPNLATIQNRGAEAILLNVLDPNREVNPKYVNYLVLTNSGKTHTGMIEDENATSVTLVRAERKTDTILRSDIDQLQSSGLSIMPEGLEKEISIPMMADLIAYLLSIQ